MTTTGTFAFNPSAADITLNAFGMIGKQPTELTTTHFQRASFCANMLGVDFSNRNPNMWAMGELSIPLIAGTAVYNLPAETVAVSAVWLDQTQGPTTVSRVLGPLSATDYAYISRKDQAGTPNCYFFRLASPTPTLTLWLVPTTAPVFTMRVQTFRQQQDASLKNGLTADVPYRFLDALTIGLAARLAVYYPDQSRPTLPTDLQQQYLAAFQLAAGIDQQRVPLRLGPITRGYYPR